MSSWRLNNTLLNDDYVINGIKKEIKKNFESSENIQNYGIH